MWNCRETSQDCFSSHREELDLAYVCAYVCEKEKDTSNEYDTF